MESSAAEQRTVLDSFDQGIGERPGFFHLNDSQHPFASNKDRHALIGEGAIGVEPFRWLLADARTEGIPLILETPHERGEVTEEDVSADPFDLKMMALLATLLMAQA
jgi:endonuclease IV